MLACLAALALGLPAFAQETGPLGPLDPNVPTYVCRRASEPMRVDGRLTEKSWQAAQPTTPFVFPWPSQPGDKQKTTAQLLWDSQALYVAYTCEDKDLTALHLKHDDPTYEDDCVEVFLNPAPAKSVFYYGLEMNCRGVLYDYFFAWPVCILNGFDLLGAKVATKLSGTLNRPADTDRGWTLEVCIPFENFRGLTDKLPPQDGERWRMQMNRWDGRDKRALSEWTPSGKDLPDPHRPAGFGVLEFSAKAVGS
jgi:hypothetical protein